MQLIDPSYIQELIEETQELASNAKAEEQRLNEELENLKAEHEAGGRQPKPKQTQKGKSSRKVFVDIPMHCLYTNRER